MFHPLNQPHVSQVSSCGEITFNIISASKLVERDCILVRSNILFSQCGVKGAEASVSLVQHFSV